MRLDSYETELRRLTAKVEELEFARRRAEQEADARIKDLEFRVIELEGGDPTAALRGDDGAPAAEPPPPSAEPPPAVAPAPGTAPGPRPLGTLAEPVTGNERAAFDAAMAELSARGPQGGRGSVEAFLKRFPGSALAPDAHLALGEAYASAGRRQEAARQFLTGFRDYGESPRSAELLLRLGETLAQLGRRDEACAAFTEFSIRYPGAAPTLVMRAESAARRTGCP
jgi:TolA-binding protein